jgi:excisionase family DNA binding protein
MTPQHEAAIRAAVDALVDAILVAFRAEVSSTSTPPDRLLSINEACRALSLGRTSLYTHFGSEPGQLRSVRVGRRRLIPASALDAFARQSAEATRSATPERPSARP